MHEGKQERNDEGTYPSKKEELCAETSQQVGYATRQSDNIPHIGTIEKEKLILLLIMQMMRIDQSEKEENGHTETEGI